MQNFDLVISNGTVIDGTGAAGRVANVGITGGRITAVTPEAVTGEIGIDAEGKVVCPGFIDLHSHADFSLEGWPEATTQLHQGVTTLLTGNCGWSPFPVGEMERLQRWTSFLGPEISWAWHDTAGFAETQNEARPAINSILQVGHHALRLAVMGEAERAPTTEELDGMCELLRTAASQGARGFSTGLIYAPGTYSSAAEIRTLVQVAAECDLLYSTHIRNESFNLLDSITEAIEAAEAAGARLEISHLKAVSKPNYGRTADALALIDAARARGVDVTADVYPYTASSTTLTTRLPTSALDGGVEAFLARLRIPDERSSILAGTRAAFARDGIADGVVISALPPGQYDWALGLSVAEIGSREGVDAAEATLRILEAHEASVAIVSHGMSENDVRNVLRHPQVSVASDGWVMRPEGEGQPHPRNFGTFSRVLGHYSRDEKVLSLEEAIRKMTSLPASRLKLADRGVLAESMVADIAVFDPEAVSDPSTFQDPWQLSTGFSEVLVAGQAVLRDGNPTKARPGIVL
ncbi:D-aminoacylase [Saxibacter everestensis]|uniref:D-aminoacylase n=1 Tax=Saxibacter everestensis TaxID=2909229 RepID=A0ABY8QRS7_9MICO|nr:D-aminoacylase [Brevibacteriaceae bacterium ZFBP1038]